ncbi:MAG: DNA polymerase III subunit delta' C-terminal domain-containing protein, partial [Chloroflexota bacterium]
ILMATSGAAGEALSNVDQIQRLTGYARTWPAAEILSCLRKTEEALWQLERNANTRLVMENLLLSYPSLQSISP